MNSHFSASPQLKLAAKDCNGHWSSAASDDLSDARVFVVGINEASSMRLADLVRNAGYRATVFENAVELLNSTHLVPPCCVLLEWKQTHAKGLGQQLEIAGRFELVPVIVLSADASLQAGIAAMKAGAIDYLVQPVPVTAIGDAIRMALSKQAQTFEFTKCSMKFRQGWQKLTVREREVLDFVTVGYLNKQIAAELGISEKTIKVHRGRVMKKMQVGSFAELVRLSERASIAENLRNERFNGRVKTSATRERSLELPVAHGELTPNCSL